MWALAAVASCCAADLSGFAQKQYGESQKRYQAEPASVEAAWQFGRGCFDLAEFATNKTERAALAEQGIAACRAARARESNSAPVRYYLGMNLGQLARTRSLSALKMVDEMEREFLAARALDPKFDHGGPDRNLGLLYRDAPSIGSVGSRTKAKQHLQRAAELVPDYPENHLNLMESYLKWGDRNGAIRELKALDAIWPKAKTDLTGPAWASAWADWEPRLANVRPKIENPPRPLQTPRH